MRLTRNTSLFILCSGFTFCLAQEPLTHAAKLHVGPSGQVYIRTDQKAYFFATPAGEPGELMLLPGRDKNANPIPFEANGTYYLAYQDSKTGKSIRYRIMADGIAPVSTLVFLKGELFKYNQTYFIEKGATIKIEVSDNMAGAAQTFTSMNGEPFQILTGSLSIQAEGVSTLRYYSADNVGNAEAAKEVRIFASQNAIVSIANIYFDLNSEILRWESLVELDKLAQLMFTYPDVHIELSAHTDARGEAKYNLKLSELRASAAVAYLISRGVKKTRIASRGYGDTMPLNECAKGVSCPEERHKQNRRIEIKITKLEEPEKK